jgi:hypothetical protein
VIRQAASLLLLLAAGGALTPPRPPVDADHDNLLNIGYGAGVVSRTGELSLENSAAHAIDGDSGTIWSTPPGGFDETMVFALPALARITRVGLTVATSEGYVPEEVRFSASMDGKTWHEVVTMNPQPADVPQFVTVRTFDARFLRVHSHTTRYYTHIRSVHAIGRELAPAPPPAPEGCWTIDGVAARFARQGARVYGELATTPPTFVDGGIEDRVVRLQWRRGPTWGIAAMTITDAPRTLTGITFYQRELGPFGLGAAWFGTPSSCPQTPQPRMVDDRRFVLYGVRFDANDRIDAAQSAAALDAAAAFVRRAQRVRIVAHEYRLANAAQNRARCVARLNAVRDALRARGIDVARIELVPSGSSANVPQIVTELQRRVASRVEIEAR